MAVIFNIDYIKGDNLSIPLTAKDDSGNIIILSSYFLRGSVKYRYSSASSLLDFNIYITNAEQGLFTLEVPNNSLDLPIVQALYDIELYDQNDTFVKKLYQGKFNIFPEITTITQSEQTNAYKIFYGTIAGPSNDVPLLNEEEIKSLQNSIISTSLVGNYQGIYNCPPISNGYKYICYPENLPLISTSIDHDSISPEPFNNIVFFSYGNINYYIVQLNLDGTLLNYRVYRTSARSNSALKIQIT
jgi:hypothetical protein